MTITTYPYAVTDQVFPIPPVWTVVSGSIALYGEPDNSPSKAGTYGTDLGWHHSVLTAEGQLGMKQIIDDGLNDNPDGFTAIRDQYGTPFAIGTAFSHTPDDVFGDGTKYWMETTGIIGLGSQPWDAGTRTAADWQKFEDLAGDELAIVPDPVAPAWNDPGVASITDSQVGQTNGTRATNVWYKLFKPWCHFNYGTAQTGFDAFTNPGKDDPATWWNNNWEGVTKAGPVNFEFAQSQTRPETDFFDHERMPIVILDNKHAYLCAALPLCAGAIHAFFEVSVWVSDNGYPDTKELQRVDPADIWSLGLHSIVLANGVVRTRNANSQDSVRSRGFCGLVYRNKAITATSPITNPANVVIPGGMTVWQQWGNGAIFSQVNIGGNLIYGTDVTDLKLLRQGVSHLNIVPVVADTSYSLDLTNNYLEVTTPYLQNSTFRVGSYIVAPGAGPFCDKTEIIDLYRYGGSSSEEKTYTVIPTAEDPETVVFRDLERFNNTDFFSTHSPAWFMNGVALAHYGTQARLAITPAPYPVRSRWGTHVQRRPYKLGRFTMSNSESLMAPTPVYLHTDSWLQPTLTYSASSATAGPDPAGIGLFPYTVTSKTSSQRFNTYTEGDRSTLYLQTLTKGATGPATDGWSHSEQVVIEYGASNPNGPIFSNSGTDFYPNAGTTISGGPTEAYPVIFIAWNFSISSLGQTHHSVTGDAYYGTSADIQIVLWDLVNNAVGLTLQSATVTGGTNPAVPTSDQTLFHGTRQIDMTELPAEWALMIMCTSASAPNPAPAITGSETSFSRVTVLLASDVHFNNTFEYWIGIPRDILEDKYMRTEKAARGEVLMSEDIMGIDVAYCSTFDPFPYTAPGLT